MQSDAQMAAAMRPYWQAMAGDHPRRQRPSGAAAGGPAPPGAWPWLASVPELWERDGWYGMTRSGYLRGEMPVSAGRTPVRASLSGVD
jgi:hypothetical protein